MPLCTPHCYLSKAGHGPHRLPPPRFGLGRVDEGSAREYLIGHRLEVAEEKLAVIEGEQSSVLLPMDAAWVISCATLVFLMQLGFAQLEAGMCRPKMSSQHI